MNNKLTDQVIKRVPELRRIRNIFQPETVEPQRGYMFEAYFLTTGATSGDVVDFFTNSLLKLFVKSIELPSNTNTQIPVWYLGKQTMYNGKEASDKTISITYWDDEGTTVYTFFNRWMKLLGNNEIIGSVSKQAYKSDMIIKLKDTSDVVSTKEITLKNCFPIDIAKVALTYESSDAMEINITMGFDYVEIVD